MRQSAGPRLSVVFALLVAMAAVVSGQDDSTRNVLSNQNPSQKGVLPCKAGTNFEAEKYRIVHTTVDDPFKFLYWIGGKSKSIEAQLAAKLNNQPFTYKLVDADGLTLIENARFAPDSGIGFSVRIELVSVQNCDPNAKTLDVIYRIYSTDPPKFLGGATES
jgi:hypothetical protein